MEPKQEMRAALYLWVAASRALGGIEDRLRRQVETHGLSLTEFGVLEALLHKGPLPIGEIGSTVLLTSGSMTYVIDKLERRGLLQRRRSEEDRRVQFADLTPEGRSLIEVVFPEHAGLIRDLTNVLTLEEKQETAAKLTRLWRFAEEHADDPDAQVTRSKDENA